MPTLRALPLLLLSSCLLGACGSGPRFRILSSDFGAAPRAEPETVAGPERDTAAQTRTRIGAPGGSGAGARSVSALSPGTKP